jgi:hypothetical protein
MEPGWLRGGWRLGILGSVLVLGCGEPGAAIPEGASPAAAAERAPVAAVPDRATPTEPARLPPLLESQPLEGSGGSPASGVSEARQVGYTQPEPKNGPAYGHAPDYGWLVGTLHYSAVRKVWRLRFAAAEDPDRYGGSVTLIAPEAIPPSLNGKWVRAEGNLSPSSESDPNPGYRVRRLQPLDEP